MEEITRCPECGAGLQAVKLQYYDKVVLTPQWQVLSAEPSEFRDAVWQIYCENGHRLSSATGVS